MIELDGASGEGGGQILRTALSLSCITGKPFRIRRIRGNRSQPGLMAQHLSGVRAAAQISAATVEGDSKNSQTLVFDPGSVSPGDYRFDIGTAGAASLVFQTIVYPLASAGVPSTVTVSGGTHVPWSPSYPYLLKVWAWWYEQLGGQVALSLDRAGFYPRGGGALRATVSPCREVAMPKTERGRLEYLQLYSEVSDGLPSHILQRQVQGAQSALEGRQTHPELTRLDSFSPGTHLMIEGGYTHTRAGFGSLGQRGKKAERVGQEAARAWDDFDRSGALLDAHMADQILLPASLALPSGERLRLTTERVSNHLLTNAHTIGAFLPVRIEVDGAIGCPGCMTLMAP